MEIFLLFFLELRVKSYYHSKDKMGSPGSSGSLLKVSIDIEIFCTYKEYYLLLRFQKKILVFSVKITFKPKSNIFTHFGQGGKKTLSFLHKTLRSSYFSHFIFLTTICGENLLINRLDYHSIAYWVHKKIKREMEIFQNFSTSAPCTIVLNMLHPFSTSKNWCTRK